MNLLLGESKPFSFFLVVISTHTMNYRPKTQLTAICLMAAAATVNSHFLNNVVLASAGNSSAPTISTNTTIAFPKALPSSMSFASSLSIPGSMLVLLLGSGGLLLL